VTETENVLMGSARVFGDNINTDYIIASKYKSKVMDVTALVPHVMEDIRPGFAATIAPGDLLVAGENFGSGSSREIAARVLREAGLSAVLARSFARIFFRNAINVGFPVLEVDTRGIEEGDRLELDLSSGVLRNMTRHWDRAVATLPPVMLEILRDGGLAAHLRKHRGFAFAARGVNRG